MDVVALVSIGSPPKKLLAQMRLALERASSISKMSTVEIPCRTVDAVDIVRDQACANDIIVTDSAPFAYEFLQKGGEATDCFGEVFTRQDISIKVRHFQARQELKRLGVNPYKPRPYRVVDRERLQESLKRLIGAVCSVTPRETALDLRWAPTVNAAVKPLTLSEFEKGSDAKVFVDGDACPVLPAILEICGNANVPVVFVSNHEPGQTARSMRDEKYKVWLGGGNPPEVAIETVPVEKDAADRFIERHIALGDIVLTDDTALMTICMNKGALAIDFRGRALGRPPECTMLGKADVKQMRASYPVGRKKRSRANAFRSSLMQAVGLGVGFTTQTQRRRALANSSSRTHLSI